MQLPHNLNTGNTAKYPGDYKEAAKPTVSLWSSQWSDSGDKLFYMKIVVPGTPIGKPRMTRQDKWKKRPCAMRYRLWCDYVRSVVTQLPPADTVKSLRWTAYFEPPPSWPKQKRIDAIGTFHRARPDRDNIDKAVLDCLYPHGDSGIAHGALTKRWDWKSRLEIKIVYEVAATVRGE